MGAMELLIGSPISLAPYLIRNAVSWIIVLFDDSLVKSLLGLVRSLFLFFLALIYSSSDPSSKNDAGSSSISGGGLAGALSQLLSAAAEVPVASRKHELVRSMAERLIDDNQRIGSPALLEINRTVLSAAFARTVAILEEAISREGGYDVARGGPRWCYRAAMAAMGGKSTEVSRPAAEKVAAEIVWLARKMLGCGFGKEAVRIWVSADGLARLALSAEPRLQCSLVKLSALLLKHCKVKEMKMKMIESWIALLCRASNGTNEPILNSVERRELEKILEEAVNSSKSQQQREKVLAIWLHHFTRCSSSDWPDLRPSYFRWCDSSRHELLLQKL